MKNNKKYRVFDFKQIPLADRVRLIEAELEHLRRLLGLRENKKSLKAWEKLDMLGKKISKKWETPHKSWELISEGRR